MPDTPHITFYSYASPLVYHRQAVCVAAKFFTNTRSSRENEMIGPRTVTRIIRRVVPRTVSGLALAIAAILLAAQTLSTLSFAEDYPARPIRIIVPFGPGGPADV